MAETHPLAGATDLWQEVIDDLEATAAEYEADGWETVTVHPGDVTPLPTRTALLNGVDVDRVGLDLLVPGNEFEELTTAIEGETFDEYDAFRAESGSLVFLVIVMKGETVAVCFPIYYDAEQAGIMLRRSAERGEFRTYLRPLDDSERVVFSQAEPERLLPVEFDPDDVDVSEFVEADGSDRSRFPLSGEDLAERVDDGSETIEGELSDAGDGESSDNAAENDD